MGRYIYQRPCWVGVHQSGRTDRLITINTIHGGSKNIHIVEQTQTLQIMNVDQTILLFDSLDIY